MARPTRHADYSVSRIAVTMEIYTAADNISRREAIDKLNALFGTDSDCPLLSLAPGRWPYRPPGVAGSVRIVEPGSGGTTWSLDVARLQAIRQQSRALALRAAEARARARATCDQAREGRSRREILRDSAFARLRAQMATMAAIEQAKGIVMTQRGCGPDEAFDVLRQVSQRTNVKLHVLAAQLVKAIASGKDGGNVTSISLGTGRDLLP